MSKQLKSVLKGYFNTGDIPTEAQFSDLIDSLNTVSDNGLGLKGVNDSEGNLLKQEVDFSAIMVNVSALTGATYESAAAAAAALISKSSVITAVTNGMSIMYKDSMGRIWTYKYENGEWILNGDRLVVTVSETLNNDYINSSGELYTSNVLSGEGTETSPYVYEFGTTPFIEIHDLDGIYYKGKLNSGVIGVCGYDKNYKLLSSFALIKGSSTDQVVESYIKASSLPSGIKYVRFCTKLAYIDALFRVESDSATEHNAELLAETRKDVRNLKLMTSYGFSGFWDRNSLNPLMESSIGNSAILDDWSWLLIKEDGDNTKIIGKLQKNNILKFTDGTYAPVVVKGANQTSEHDWETNDLGYAIVRAWNKNKFIIDGIGDDGRDTKGIYDEQVTINGLQARLLERTGICADLPTEYNGVLRCIPFKSDGSANAIDTGCGTTGNGGLVNAFKTGSYIKTNVSQLTTMSKARAKNTVATNKNVFSEQMGIQKLSHIYAHFLKYGTYYLHSPYKFGGGTSSNEGSPTASNWGTISGVRWSIDNRSTYSYGAFSTTPSNFYKDSNKGTTNLSDLLNSHYSKWNTMEAQLALSYAADNNVAPNTEFTIYGRTYYYKDIDGAKTLLEGEMNAKLFKMVTTTFNAYSASDTSTPSLTVNMDIILEASVVDGYVSWGDVFDYGWAGMECVSTRKSTSLRYMDVYLCSLQSNLSDETAVQQTTKFGFQSTYDYIGRSLVTNHSDVYAATMLPFSIVPYSRGGGLGTGQAAYDWVGDYYGGNTTNLSRLGIRGRGHATTGICSSRIWYGNHLASHVYVYFAPAYQVRLVGLV